MRLLDRYLLRELLVPLGVCLCGFFIFWVSFDLFSELDDLQELHLAVSDVALYYAYKSPQFLGIVLPIGLLLALLHSLTRHARYNEITAMRAAGISLWRVCVPHFAVGITASVVLFALNEFWAPRWAVAAQQLLERSGAVEPGADSSTEVRNLGFSNARDGRSWQIGAYHLESEEMEQPKVYWYDKDGALRAIYAQKAVRTNGVWVFLHAQELIDVGTTNRMFQLAHRTNEWALPMLTETPEQIRSEIHISRRLSRLADTDEADIPLSVILDYLRLHPNPDPSVASWLSTMFHGRIAAPWTCAVVVVIAVPFAAVSGRRNLFVGVASSILICFAYFVLQQLCLALGAGGHLPAWLAAWLPNGAFSLGGLWMMARVR